MYRNEGWWYDRRHPRYHKIDDHARAAAENPKRYRQDRKLNPFERDLNPVTEREELITAVARQGFIRIRFLTGNLGWQFWGDPERSYQTLLRFLARHDVGDYVEVAFTDLAKPFSVRGTARDFRRFRKDPTVIPLLDTLLKVWDSRNLAIC